MSKDLPVKKIYIDSRFMRRDSVSTSNFKFELPYTLKLPDNAIFYVDDVCIPRNWYTVEAGVNDKLYIRISDPGFVPPETLHIDYIITLDAKNYNGTQFAAAVQSKITSITGGGNVCTCTYDNQSMMMSVHIANLEIQFFTDEELKDVPTQLGQNFNQPYNSRDLASGNELLTNNKIFYDGDTAIPVQYYLNLTPVRNIYMRSPNLSSFNTIGCNGESSIIKKIPVTSQNGDMIFNNILSANDFLECSRATWKTLEFHLVDVNSNYINLHGANVSFSLIFDKQIPD